MRPVTRTVVVLVAHAFASTLIAQESSIFAHCVSTSTQSVARGEPFVVVYKVKNTSSTDQVVRVNAFPSVERYDDGRWVDPFEDKKIPFPRVACAVSGHFYSTEATLRPGDELSSSCIYASLAVIAVPGRYRLACNTQFRAGSAKSPKAYGRDYDSPERSGYVEVVVVQSDRTKQLFVSFEGDRKLWADYVSVLESKNYVASPAGAELQRFPVVAPMRAIGEAALRLATATESPVIKCMASVTYATFCNWEAGAADGAARTAWLDRADSFLSACAAPQLTDPCGGVEASALTMMSFNALYRGDLEGFRTRIGIVKARFPRLFEALRDDVKTLAAR